MIKQILFVLFVLVIATPAVAQLQHPISINYATAPGPTAPFTTTSVSSQVLYVTYAASNWSTTDTLIIVQAAADTSNASRVIKLGPSTTYATTGPVAVKDILTRGTATGVKYSLIIQ